jgi:hypothetical protein
LFLGFLLVLPFEPEVTDDAAPTAAAVVFEDVDALPEESVPEVLPVAKLEFEVVELLDVVVVELAVLVEVAGATAAEATVAGATAGPPAGRICPKVPVRMPKSFDETWLS